MFYRPRKNAGFSIIELLVVLAIVGAISSVVLSTMSGTRAKTRDAQRIADLKHIETLLEIYRDENDTYRVAGGGWNGTGLGWFNYIGGSNYPNSVAQQLVDDNYTSTLIAPPGNCLVGQCHAYMIYASDITYTLWTSLERPTQEHLDTQDNCSLSTYDNYHSTYSPENRMNYCVSN